MDFDKINLCNCDEEPEEEDDPRDTDIQEGGNRPVTGDYY